MTGATISNIVSNPRSNTPSNRSIGTLTSSTSGRLEATVWADCYPPDFDHGGRCLLGDDPNRWGDLLDNTAFLGAECAGDGRVVVLVARVTQGFIEVNGQFVRQGEPLGEAIAETLKNSAARVPVDRGASRLLGLNVELDQASIDFDWQAAARRIELDLLSTIAHIAARKPESLSGSESEQ